MSLPLPVPTLAGLLRREGGWYPGNRPGDPNPTMWGVTQHVYDAERDRLGLPRRSVRFISQDEVRTLYDRSYWTGAHAPEVAGAWGLPSATVHFDAAVNHGVERAVAFAQEYAGVPQDGQWGPRTASAVAAKRPGDPTAARWYLGRRAAAYRALAAAVPAKAEFLGAWLRRLVQVGTEVGVSPPPGGSV